MFNVKIGLTPDGKIPPALVRRALRKDRGRDMMDWRSLAKRIPQDRREFDEEQARRADFADKTTVVDVTKVEAAPQCPVQHLSRNADTDES